MRIAKPIFILAICTLMMPLFGQSQGHLSGDVMMNLNIFERDTARGAANTPHYDNLMTGGEAWVTLNYALDDFDAGLRFDMFNNSNLHNPTIDYSGEGVGTWYVRKKVKQLTATAGYFYDQYGSGIIFRAYEDRGLGIDNSIYGLNLKYELNENWTIKGFSGRQKNRFETYAPIIKGGSLEGYLDVSDKIKVIPGVGLVNRTMDQKSMNSIVSTINSYDLEDRFIPKYNVYAYSFYTTVNWGRFELFGELARKTNEATVNANGQFIDSDGEVRYGSLTYSQKGFGITGQYKRTESFSMRTSPNETLLNGMVNFLPPLTRQNTWRLTSRYAAASQELGEEAYQLDIIFTPVKKLNVQLNGSYVTNLEGRQLYQERYIEFKYKASKKLVVSPGFQTVEYDQVAYEGKGDQVVTMTPFIETVYKITRKKSVRLELSAMDTDEDYGSWTWALLEYNVAPKWSFSVSDMYNIRPKKTEKLHYPSFFAAYTKGANRFTAAYVKQVEGIVCTGGVCRLEPAFSGVKISVTSSF